MIAQNPRQEAFQALGDPPLTPQQAHIVEVLYNHPGYYLSIDEIERQIPATHRKFETTDAVALVKTQVCRLRYKTGMSDIVNKRGAGYRLSDDFRAKIDAALEGL